MIRSLDFDNNWHKLGTSTVANLRPNYIQNLAVLVNTIFLTNHLVKSHPQEKKNYYANGEVFTKLNKCIKMLEKVLNGSF